MYGIIFTLGVVTAIGGESIVEKIDWSHMKSLIAQKEPQGINLSVPLVPEARIIGGNIAPPDFLPYQVGIIVTLPGGPQALCGGALISQDYVLTAAHCLYPSIYHVLIFGATNIEDARENGQIRMLNIGKRISYHPQFDVTTLQNDIAIIKLPHSVEFNDQIRPIRLPALQQADDTYVGEMATASGWGVITDDMPDFTPYLQYVEMPVMDLSECQRYYQSDVVQPTNICTDTSGGKGTCNGDCGSPLTAADETNIPRLIGIMSFGAKKGCASGVPVVSVRVGFYLKWISEVTEIPLSA